tara:strand:- start:13317 stop:15521 length:2205 start_codon:yes stop_codon:yes gene_type:complete
MTKYILGLQSYANHDSGACIIKFKKNTNPELIAISEERLLRNKYPYSFPVLSIIYCMKHFKLKNFNQIDLIVSDWIRLKRWIRSGPSYNYQEFDYIKENLKFNKKKIIQIDHHLAHAASTYYPSNFKSSSVLVIDGNGSDIETNSFFVGKGNNIKLIENYKNHGIGFAYEAVTKEILNFSTGGEGKTMGLAPYGKYNKKIKIPYEINGVKTNFSKFMLRMPVSDVLNRLNENFRPNVIKQKIRRANKQNIMNKYFTDWAFMIQKTTEDVVSKLGNNLYNKTKNKNICLAGGVALNSVANEVLFKRNKFKDIFIFPACADAGIPYGLAIWAYHNYFNQKKRIPFVNAYTGIIYSSKKISKLLKKYKIEFKSTSASEIAKLISEKNIIGNFHGCSEYGPRALGNRSILADARDKNIRNKINKFIKHREVFRPFAPAILEEKSKEYFNIKFSPFMLRVTKSKKKNIPSALHVDNTARVQTVNKKQNRRFYSIINEFYKQTNVPVLLNTSFNDAGEPLVETPMDALITSLKTNIDYLILENFIVSFKNITIDEKKFLLKKIEDERSKIIKKNYKDGIKILTKKYSKKEIKKRIKEENKKAIYNTLYKPFDLTKKYFENFNKSKKLTIIGSNDHTNVLLRLFQNQIKKIKNINYFEIAKNDIHKKKVKIKILKKINKLSLSSKSNYFISSFQYMHEISEKIKLKNTCFSPYDNSSRSLIDYYFIKKFKNKKKINSIYKV